MAYLKQIVSPENIERLGFPIVVSLVMFFLVVYLIKSNQKQTSKLLERFEGTWPVWRTGLTHETSAV